MRAGPLGKLKRLASMEPIVGQTVSHYAFLEKLGAGGMGEIYKARDSRLNRIVAVKVLAPGRTRDPERRRRFIQEAQAASALNHPNIITIHDILSESDTQYMVMEHVSGKTLHALIAAGRLPVAQALQISDQMANALAAAHAAGIIHRDLKPANVMVTSSGLVKILDFGLAKLMDPTATPSAGSDSSGSEDPVTLTAAPLTVEGSIMGTVNYMSPEQAEGLKVDARSDIFSFGAVLYEMVTGQRAFDGRFGDLYALGGSTRRGEADSRNRAGGSRRIRRPDRAMPAEESGRPLAIDGRSGDGAEQPESAGGFGRRATPGRRSSRERRLTAADGLRSRRAFTPLEHAENRRKEDRCKSVGSAGSRRRSRGGFGDRWRLVADASPKCRSAQPVSAGSNRCRRPRPPPGSASPLRCPATAEPETKNDAADAIAPTAAPPPSTPIVPLVNKSKTLPPPPVVAPTTPVQPQVATSTPAPPAPVAVAPAPRAPAAPEACR